MAVTSTKFFLLLSRPQGTSSIISLENVILRSVSGGAQIATGGTALETTHYSLYDSSRLFNGVGGWLGDEFRRSGYVGYNFGASNPKSVAEIELRNAGSRWGTSPATNENPKNAVLFALDSVTGDLYPCMVAPNITWGSTSDIKTYAVDLAPASSVWRVRVTSPGIGTNSGTHTLTGNSVLSIGEIEMALAPAGASIYDGADTAVVSPLKAATGLATAGADEKADAMAVADGLTGFPLGTFTALLSGSSTVTNNDPVYWWVAFAWPTGKAIQEVRITTPNSGVDYVQFPNILVVERWTGTGWEIKGALDVTSTKAPNTTYTIATGTLKKYTTRCSAQAALGAMSQQSKRTSISYALDSNIVATRALSSSNAIASFVPSVAPAALQATYASNAFTPAQALLSARWRIQAFSKNAEARTFLDANYGIGSPGQVSVRLLDIAYKITSFTEANREFSFSWKVDALSGVPRLLTANYATKVLARVSAPAIMQARYRVRAFTRSYVCSLTASNKLNAYQSGTIWLDANAALGSIQSYSALLDSLYAILANRQATTWVANAKTGAVSQYSGFSFVGYADIGGVLYGITDSGLYKLDGAQVSGKLRTRAVDFRGDDPVVNGADSRHLKRATEVYLGLHGTTAADVTVLADQTASPTYEITGIPTALQSQKVPIGRGLRGRYWQVEAEGVLNLDTIDMNVVTSTNRVK